MTIWEPPKGADGAIDRRQLFARGAQGAVGAFAAADLLAACGGSSSSASSTATTRAAPKRGGTLTVGQLTSGATESMVPGTDVETYSTRALSLYESLWTAGPDLTPIPILVESAEPNATATRWTIRLRSGVRFHNGQPLTADDLLWSLHTFNDPSQNVNASITRLFLDTANSRKRDALTVEMALHRPIAEIPGVFSSSYYSVIPNGATVADLTAKPNGTGPFKYVPGTFVRGSRSVFVANRDYWMPGLPYIDELIILSSFTDDAARLDALLSGTIDVDLALPFALASRAGTQFKLLSSPSPGFFAFPMRVDVAPFSDVRVRQALRLLVNRPQFVEDVFDGHGTLANDMPNVGAPYYASGLPQRAVQIEQAKSLLKSAGHSDLAVTLDDANEQDGYISSGTLLKQAARSAGATVNLDISPASSWDLPGHWLTFPFSVTAWIAFTNCLTSFYLICLNSNAPYNETHWGTPTADALLFDAIGTVDPSSATDKWLAVQKLQYDEGGYLSWGNQNYIDGLAPNVMGLVPSKAGWCNNFSFRNVWLA